MNPPHTLFIGLGSPHGDDRIGWEAADRLRGAAPPYVAIRKAPSPLAILDRLEEFGMRSAECGMEPAPSAFHTPPSPLRRLVICDACQGLGRPGETRRWGWPPFTAAMDRAGASPSEFRVGREQRHSEGLTQCLSGKGDRHPTSCGGADINPQHPGPSPLFRTDTQLRAASGGGTHDFSLPQVLELAQRLGWLPPRVEVWALEIGASAQEQGLSAEVAAALPRLVRELENDLKHG